MIYIICEANKKNLQENLYNSIRLVYHEIPTVVYVIHDLTVRIFDNLSIISWYKIDCTWIYSEQVLRGIDLNKLRSVVISCRDIMKSEALNGP